MQGHQKFYSSNMGYGVKNVKIPNFHVHSVWFEPISKVLIIAWFNFSYYNHVYFAMNGVM
jgi:hypothetical protein